MKPGVRFSVFKRDNFTCQYCGRKPPNVVLEADHVLAVANGGSDAIHNLVTSCQDCNRGKGANQLCDRLAPLAETMAIERERAEQLNAYNKWLKAEAARNKKSIATIERACVELSGSDPEQCVPGLAWKRAILSFHGRLPEQQIINALAITFARVPGGACGRSLKYFCGVCWHLINGEDPR